MKIAAVLALIAGVAGLGAYLERQRANEEMAGRLAAEVERDALARQSLYSAALTQAQRALEQDDYGRARKFLDEALPAPGGPDLRQFEWHALRQDAAGDPAVVLRASGPPGQQVVFSPDGQLVAAQTTDRQSAIWDRASRRELRHIPGVQQLAGFSTDGRWLLGVDDKFALRRWAVADGQPEPPADDSRNWPLGRLEGDRWLTYVIATAQRPLQLRGWDFSTGRELWRGPLPHTAGPDDMETGSYFSSAVSGDGRACAIALIHGRGSGARWRIMVLSLPDLALKWDRVFDHRPTALAFGRTNDELIYGWGDTGEAGLIDLRTGEPRWQTRLPMTQLRAIVHDGEHLLAVGGRSSLIALLDLETGKPTGSRRGQESDLVSLAFLPATRELLSTGNGGDVRVWSLQDPVAPATLRGYWNPAAGGRKLCLSPDGGVLAATAAMGVTRLVQTRTGHTLAELAGTDGPIAFTPGTNALWLLSAEGGLILRSPDQPAADVRAVSLPIPGFIASASPDCRWIACLDKEANLVLVDTLSGKVSPVIKTGHRYPWWVAVSGDGLRVATGGVDAMVRIWEIPSGRRIEEWKPANETVNATFSPDGRHLALAQNTGTLEVHDLAAGQTAATLVTSSGLLQAIVYDPAAPRLFLGGRDGTLHVIDTSRWREITQLKVAPGEAPGSLARNAISADGKTLAGYTESGVIRLWRKAALP